MARPAKFEATDSTGRVWRRSSVGRSYKFAVVVTLAAVPADRYGHSWPERRKAEWAGDRRLAENNANRWRRCNPTTVVEIVEAVCVQEAAS